MKFFYFFLALWGLSLNVTAQTPVWSTDVAPIIYNRCANCHRSGGIAPFTLTSYADASSRSAAIKSAVEAGRMPPWPPDPAYSRLAHERVLSATEKKKISAWVSGGMPRGNASLEPPVPTFSNAGDLPGTPDLTLKIPKYTATASTQDVYRCFVLPTGLTADKFITAFEAIPGNRSIVHHVLVYADTTGQSTALDSAEAGPGYTSFGGIGTSDAALLGGWVPGSQPIINPAGFGLRLSKNAKVVVQIHYPAGSAGLQDSTELHFFFTPTNNVRPLMLLQVLNHAANINAPLVIPANTVRSFVEQQSIPVDVTAFGITPHMHLIGTQIESFCITPAGDTQRFISIPKWDFHWQGFYTLRKAMKVSAGSTVYARATFDNTTNNPHNPSNPPKPVTAGEATTDEMMVVYFMFALYKPGDENIMLDTTAPAELGIRTMQPYYKGVQLLQPYPIPAKDQLIAKYHLDQSSAGSLELLNMSGQSVMQVFRNKRMDAGYTALPIDIRSLPDGIYTLRLSAAGLIKSCTVSIQH